MSMILFLKFTAISPLFFKNVIFLFSVTLPIDLFLQNEYD